jgi:CRISPR/Cas system-associated exonuclease Cas4 (RecB family)
LNKPTVRSSSLPLLMTCSNAVLNPDGLDRAETFIEPAVLGNLVHAECERLVKTGGWDPDSLRQRLSKPDFERAWHLFQNFLDVYREAAKYMTSPVTELGLQAELSHVHLTGHIDLSHMEAKRAFVIDYKTGRQHEDHFHQMAGYAFLIWDHAGRPMEYTVYVSAVYLEDKSVHSYTFNPESLLEWEKELAHQVTQPRYSVSRKCANCSLADSCPAYLTYAKGARAMLLDTLEGTPTWDDLTAEERGRIVDQMYLLEKAIDRVKQSLRNRVRRGGPLDVGDGKEYTLVPTDIKRVKPEVALPILQQRIGQNEDLLATLEISLDQALAAFATKAAKGKKASARRDLLQELDDAGAIERITTERMFRRPKSEPQMQD